MTLSGCYIPDIHKERTGDVILLSMEVPAIGDTGNDMSSLETIGSPVHLDANCHPDIHISLLVWCEDD